MSRGIQDFLKDVGFLDSGSRDARHRPSGMTVYLHYDTASEGRGISGVESTQRITYSSMFLLDPPGEIDYIPHI
jgi:hypothetical protein